MRSLVLVFVLLSLGLEGCVCRNEPIEPSVCYTPPAGRIAILPSPFEPLSSSERRQEWGKELVIAEAFAKEMDGYRAITAYRRASILLPPEASARRQQIDYGIVLSYFLAQRYNETVEAFETSSLVNVDASFPAYRNLLILLYSSYQKLCQSERSERVMELLHQVDDATARDLELSRALEQADFSLLQTRPQEHKVSSLLACYCSQSKSPAKARALNSVLPGAGYWYVGQHNTAITSFLLNALFVWASVEFFHHHDVAAGLIALGFEGGWYFGGINGAGLAAKQYDEQLYACLAKESMVKEKLFPILMFTVGF